jgi:hypothetical protein
MALEKALGAHQTTCNIKAMGAQWRRLPSSMQVWQLLRQSPLHTTRSQLLLATFSSSTANRHRLMPGTACLAAGYAPAVPML